jgi:hypothetical protein
VFYTFHAFYAWWIDTVTAMRLIGRKDGSMRSMRSMRWGFYFPKSGALAKGMPPGRDADTHAKPQLPPGAALGCVR